MRLTISTLLALLIVAGCGVGPVLVRGDKLLKAGDHDKAIASYREAVTRSQGTPEHARCVDKLNHAKLIAAHHHMARGDNEREQRHLIAAGKAYKRASGYAPTDQEVVRRQSDLLKLRLRIETNIDESTRTLALLRSNPEAAKDIRKWLDLVRIVEGLQAWKHDYAAVEALYGDVATPAADALVADAQRLMAVEDFDRASIQIQKAMRLVPEHKRANELHRTTMVRGNAARLAAKGNEAIEAGNHGEAIAQFEKSLAIDPKSYAATQGLREARLRYVKARIEAIDRALKAKDRRAALLAAREGDAVGTDYPKVAKELATRYGKLHSKLAARFYNQGRKHENARLYGAALIAFRTAAALGGGGKDVGRRIEKNQRIVAQQRQLTLHVPPIKVPASGFTPASELLQAGLLARFAASTLPSSGVVLVQDRKQSRNADGTLALDVAEFNIARSSRPEPRRKRFLDRVEFPHNRQWDIAQSQMSATLGELNAATDELRPVQEQLNAAELKLAKLDSDLIALKETIRKEDAAHYADKEAPCPDGTSNCKESFANRRWAKHLTYFRDEIAKQNGVIATVSPRYTELRDRVHKLQQDFRAAEKAAHATPEKLRQEIWLDHNYEVTLHEVHYKAQATLAWTGKPAPQTRRRRRKQPPAAPLATHSVTIAEDKVDFSTPGVIIKDQTLEPPKQNALADDIAIATAVSTALLDQLTASVWPALALQGERFAARSQHAAKPGEKLHYAVLALATGDALAPATRAGLVELVRAQTGYDYERMAVDFEKLPGND